jgi:hypothetical protein
MWLSFCDHPRRTDEPLAPPRRNIFLFQAISFGEIDNLRHGGRHLFVGRLEILILCILCRDVENHGCEIGDELDIGCLGLGLSGTRQQNNEQDRKNRTNIKHPIPPCNCRLVKPYSWNGYSHLSCGWSLRPEKTGNKFRLHAGFREH